jgi:hypothetical protein
MDISHLLARLFGIVLIVVYGGLLLNQKFYKRVWNDVFEQPLILFLSGFMALILGLIVTQVHNVWTLDWRVLMTLLGWMLVFQGVIRILFPEFVLKMAKRLLSSNRFLFIQIASIMMILIGSYLTLKGFFFF